MCCVLMQRAMGHVLCAVCRVLCADVHPNVLLIFRQLAYTDCPHEIGYGQTISAPHMHAYALEDLKDSITKPGARVLDVGSGSGYLSACMGAMGAEVDGIELVTPLVEWSKHNLHKTNPELEYKVVKLASLKSKSPTVYNQINCVFFG